MEWSKIPTNLINGKFEDAEILAIVKYQLLYALYEEQPNEKILSKFLTKKQKNIVKNFVGDIQPNVEKELNAVHKKRQNDKLYYAENKEKSQNSDNLSDNLSDNFKPEQIRLDKIRKEKEKEKEKNFTEFYELYPRKKEKQKAFTAYLKAIKKTSHEKIMQGLRAYKEDIEKKKTDTQYIKHPASWLNAGCWDDDYITTKEEQFDYANTPWKPYR